LNRGSHHFSRFLVATLGENIYVIERSRELVNWLSHACVSFEQEQRCVVEAMHSFRFLHRRCFAEKIKSVFHVLYIVDLKSIFFFHPPASIDYRCDDQKKFWVGYTSWYHCVAVDSRIPKMSVINPLQALVHPQTK
jgi:hypothetical protein